MIEPVDLGVCRGYDYGGDGPVALVLPGRMLAGMPVTAFAIQPLVRRGLRVVQVWDEYLDLSADPARWVGERLEAAFRHAGAPERPLVVAKSLSTLAAGTVTERRWPAVWLTPLLDRLPDRLGPAPAMVVGGTADPSWDGARARSLGAEVVELDGADHGLARIEDVGAVSTAIGGFVDRL